MPFQDTVLTMGMFFQDTVPTKVRVGTLHPYSSLVPSPPPPGYQHMHTILEYLETGHMGYQTLKTNLRKTLQKY